MTAATQALKELFGARSRVVLGDSTAAATSPSAQWVARATKRVAAPAAKPPPPKKRKYTKRAERDAERDAEPEAELEPEVNKHTAQWREAEEHRQRTNECEANDCKVAAVRAQRNFQDALRESEKCVAALAAVAVQQRELCEANDRETLLWESRIAQKLQELHAVPLHRESVVEQEEGQEDEDEDFGEEY